MLKEPNCINNVCLGQMNNYSVTFYTHLPKSPTHNLFHFFLFMGKTDTNFKVFNTFTTTKQKSKHGKFVCCYIGTHPHCPCSPTTDNHVYLTHII
jgi:hypothetical protein